MKEKKFYSLREECGNIYTMDGDEVVVCDCGYVYVPGVTDDAYEEDCNEHLAEIHEFDSEYGCYRDFMYDHECPKCGKKDGLISVADADDPFHMDCAQDWCDAMNESNGVTE
jgi:hypothetical protein